MLVALKRAACHRVAALASSGGAASKTGARPPSGVTSPPAVARVRTSEDQVVWTVVWLLGQFQRLTSWPFYTPLAVWRGFPERRDQYLNYIYVGLWAVILVAVGFLQVLAPACWPLTIAVAFFALWRLTEIITWYLKMLLDKGHSLILAPERNLLFLFIDSLLALGTLAVLLSLAGGPHDLPGTWLDALAIFTLNGSPFPGAWSAVATVLGTLSGVVLLAAGLALLVGIITRRFTPEAATKSYEGPTRPPRPNWLGGPSEPNPRVPLIPQHPDPSGQEPSTCANICS